MLHWSHKLPAVAVVALAVVSLLGKVSPLGFSW
jgi:hypothetical protein